MTSGDETAAKFVCPFEGCTQGFTNVKYFKRHKKTHIPKQPKLEHKCEQCGLIFPKPSRLERHIRTHNGERPFKCDIEDCLKSYTNLCHLKRHKKVSHDPLRVPQEIICDEPNCGRIFESNYGLKRHVIRNHGKDSKAFSCEQCKASFSKRNKLQLHIASVHPENIKSACFECNKCSLFFTSQIQFSQHKRNHKEYICDCSKVFHRWTELCRHKRESCSEKQVLEHKCPICEKVFTSKSNLKAHSLTHVEESKLELFYCPYADCVRSYKYKKNLIFHIGIFHEKNKKPVETEEVVKFECKEKGCDLSFETKVKIEKEEKCETILNDNTFNMIFESQVKLEKEENTASESDYGEYKMPIGPLLKIEVEEQTDFEFNKIESKEHEPL